MRKVNRKISMKIVYIKLCTCCDFYWPQWEEIWVNDFGYFGMAMFDYFERNLETLISLFSKEC